MDKWDDHSWSFWETGVRKGLCVLKNPSFCIPMNWKINSTQQISMSDVLAQANWTHKDWQLTTKKGKIKNIMWCEDSPSKRGSLSYKRCATSLALESESESHPVVSDPLWPHALYSPWNSPGQNTGVGSLSLLQGIFPTQVSCIAGRFLTIWATGEAQE